MEPSATKSQCPRCHSMKVCPWTELNEDQQYLISCLPDFEDLSMKEIRSSRFCTNCWYRPAPAPDAVA